MPFGRGLRAPLRRQPTRDRSTPRGRVSPSEATKLATQIPKNVRSETEPNHIVHRRVHQPSASSRSTARSLSKSLMARQRGGSEARSRRPELATLSRARTCRSRRERYLHAQRLGTWRPGLQGTSQIGSRRSGTIDETGQATHAATSCSDGTLAGAVVPADATEADKTETHCDMAEG